MREAMKIEKYVVDIIFQEAGLFPPEIGGLLGEEDGIISHIVIDKGKSGYKTCSYVPDVSYLNEQIQLWECKGIKFVGIFHSHYFKVTTLSDGDRSYIDAIMNAMPQSVEYLYFPLAVMPDREFIVYKAYKCNKKVEIDKEEVEFF